MRVTLEEIYWGQIAIFMGAIQLGDGKAYVRGYPVPLWTSYVLICAGLVIPILAWYLRRPLRKAQCKTSSNLHDTFVDKEKSRQRSGTIRCNVVFDYDKSGSSENSMASRFTGLFSKRCDRCELIEKSMMGQAIATPGVDGKGRRGGNAAAGVDAVGTML